MASGGKRVPARPAAVSGPGNISQRTDGGPSAPTQPIRVPTGGGYGQAKALTEQQQAAPLPVGGPGETSTMGGAPAAPVEDPGIFGPTTMPNQPITAGVTGPPNEPLDPNVVLRQTVMQYPTPWMLRLLRQRG